MTSNSLPVLAVNKICGYKVEELTPFSETGLRGWCGGLEFLVQTHLGAACQMKGANLTVSSVLGAGHRRGLHTEEWADNGLVLWNRLSSLLSFSEVGFHLPHLYTCLGNVHESI